MKTSLKKDIIWNTLGSTLYAFTSLVFLVVATRVNGAEAAGIFTFAFSNASLLQIIGTYAGRPYQVTERDEELKDSTYLRHRYVAVMTMLVIGILLGLIRGVETVGFDLILVLLIYKACDAVAETCYGVLQKHQRLYMVGVSMMVKGIVGTLCFLLIDLMTHNLTLASLSLFGVNVLVMILYDWRRMNQCRRKNQEASWKKSLSLFRLGFFAFIFALLTQYITNIPKYAIDVVGNSEVQIIFGIIAMPATVLVLAGNFLVQPFLVKMKTYLSSGKIVEIKRLVRKICLMALGIGLICMTLGLLLGRQVFLMLYGIDTAAYLGALTLIIIGGTFFAQSYILSSVLTAMRRTASQAIVFLVASAIATILSFTQIQTLGVYGGAWSYCIAMAVLMILYVIIYCYYLIKESKGAKTMKAMLSSSSKPVHTFVVLAYKESEFLERCVESVMNQSYQSKVVIATTTPNKHIRQIAEKNGLDIKTTKHTTIGGDFDFAVGCSDTPLVTVAHQDDVYDQDYAYNIVYAYKLGYQDAQMFFTDYYEVRSGRKVSSNRNLKIKRILLLPLRLRRLSRWRWAKRFALRFGNAICCPAVTINMEKVSLPLFNYDLKSNVDWLAWERLSREKGSFVFINKKLMGHRIHGGSETSKVINDNQRGAEDMEVYLKFWPKWIAKKLTKYYGASEENNKVR